MSRSTFVIGLHRRQRVTGEPFLVGVANADLTIPAGAEIHLRRLHDGRLETAEFALCVIPPRKALSVREPHRVRGDQSDDGALLPNGDGAEARRR